MTDRVFNSRQIIKITYEFDTGSDSLRGAAGLDPGPDLDNANVGMSEKLRKVCNKISRQYP